MSDPSEHPSTNWTRGLWRPREVIEAGRNETIERAKKEGNCHSKEGRLLRANEVVGQTKKEGDYRTGGRGVRGENWTSANQDAESVKRTKGLGGVLLARERDKVLNERRGKEVSCGEADGTNDRSSSNQNATRRSGGGGARWGTR